MTRLRWLWAFFLLILSPVALHGQDLEPRSYTNVPINQSFIAVGVQRSEGDLSPTPTSILDDAELTIDAGALILSRTFALAENSAKFDFAASRLCYEGSATLDGEFVEGRRCEYGDPKMRLSWNFYGAPALSLKEFASWNPGLVLGTSLQVSIPVGTYNAEHLINGGTNRWMIRPGLGMSWRRNNWSYELMASVRFFEDNEQFYRGSHLEQEPLASLQAHLIYRLNKGRWLSLNANFFSGGETTVNGTDADDFVENSRWGATFTMPLNRHHSVKLYAHTGVVTRVGNEFDTLGVAWIYRFK